MTAPKPFTPEREQRDNLLASMVDVLRETGWSSPSDRLSASKRERETTIYRIAVIAGNAIAKARGGVE